ncbi:N-acetylneuraminate synthase [Yersinia ruckeri]|uniref:N-acetylneuraminate synthase n=1 Tax=Yersinia ruckeri TaxID=29486 RepID=UPI0020BF7A72|nr:N-acetylneuraminate synthase [Yersinia ruckeri]MCK8584844.1 N-acetylneuraminate synthase [Yersinia ruckeri]
MGKVYIVAEIGCNHNGSYEIAKKMVYEAKYAGVDAVKFQTFKADLLISKFAPKAEYQIKTTGNSESQLEMTKKLELAYDDYIKLENYAKELGLDVFSTPFDLDSIDFLASRGQKMWKIPSGEILNLIYLEKIATLPIEGKKIVLSTGMATIDEIKISLSIFEKSGIQKKDITILHCNTEYPTPFEDVNLNVINSFKSIFKGYNIGFSDHSIGYYAGIASITYGISFIEKHFTLDKNFSGPDHKASVTPDELRILCEGIRSVEKSLGSSIKCVTDSERKNKIVARKSIVAKTNIESGDIYTVDNLTVKRPGNGISPMHWYNIIGRPATRSYSIDELIEDDGFAAQEI